MIRYCFVALGSIAFGMACRPAAPPELPSEPLSGFPVVQAGPDCAPWDGAAMTVLVSAKSPHPDSIGAPYLRVAGRQLPGVLATAKRALWLKTRPGDLLMGPDGNGRFELAPDVGAGSSAPLQKLATGHQDCPTLA